jgi:hypothetical protein
MAYEPKTDEQPQEKQEEQQEERQQESVPELGKFSDEELDDIFDRLQGDS